MDIGMQGVVEDVTKSELMGLDNGSIATWNQSRTTEQLLGFIARRESAIADLGDE